MVFDKPPVFASAILAGASLLALVASGIRDGKTQDGQFVLEQLASPAAPGSGQPNLALAGDGSVLLSWLERPTGAEAVLKLSRWSGNRFAAPTEVARGTDFVVNWADFPSVLAVSRDHLVAHWLQRTPGSSFAYGVRIAQSTDGGNSWSTPLTPHRGDGRGENGFVSLFASGDSVNAVWLDGRNSGRGTANQMALMSTAVSRTGGLGAESTIDSRVCDCCQTAAAQTRRGTVVVYRDRSDAEIRDIYITRLGATGWTEGKAVHDDGWRINSCPVNGPAVAASGDTVVVAWFTAAHDTARVLAAWSTDGGDSFSSPIRLDSGEPVGRVGVALQPAGTAAVTWLERTGSGSAAVRIRRISTTRPIGAASTIATSSAGNASGFPRVLAAGDYLYFAWTMPGSPPAVQVARAQFRTR